MLVHSWILVQHISFNPSWNQSNPIRSSPALQLFFAKSLAFIINSLAVRGRGDTHHTCWHVCSYDFSIKSTETSSHYAYKHDNRRRTSIINAFRLITITTSTTTTETAIRGSGRGFGVVALHTQGTYVCVASHVCSPKLWQWQTLCIRDIPYVMCALIEMQIALSSFVGLSHHRRAPRWKNIYETIFIISDVWTHYLPFANHVCYVWICLLSVRLAAIVSQNQNARGLHAFPHLSALSELITGYFRFQFFRHKFTVICPFLVAVCTRVQLSSEWRQVCIIYHCLLAKSYCSRVLYEIWPKLRWILLLLRFFFVLRKEGINDLKKWFASSICGFKKNIM